MNAKQLEQLARRLLDGGLELDEFLVEAVRPVTADLAEARIDLDRQRRCGYPEVVFAEGKSAATLEKILRAPDRRGARRAGDSRFGESGRGVVAQVSAGALQPDRPHDSHLAGGPRRSRSHVGWSRGDCHGRHE